MLALTEKTMLIQALGKVVCDEVRIAIEPIKQQVDQLKKVLGDMPVPQDGRDGKDGKNGIDGENGKDADMDVIHDVIECAKDDIKKYVTSVIDALPKAEKGERGEKGDKGEPGEPGKDGRDGIDGVDGKSVGLDDIRSLLADLVAKAIGDIPVPRNCVGGFIDRRGHLYLSFSDGCNSDLGEVVGRDGKDCDMEKVGKWVNDFFATIEKPKDGKDGKDGVGFDDLSLDFDGGRVVTFKFVKGDNAKTYNLCFQIPLFQGVWREGEYCAADVVVREGSMWIAKKDTKTMPGSPDSDWQLCTKRGRDGKDGKEGPQGPEGKAGRNGRDLTQLAADGSRY